MEVKMCTVNGFLLCHFQRMYFKMLLLTLANVYYKPIDYMVLKYTPLEFLECVSSNLDGMKDMDGRGNEGGKEDEGEDRILV